MPTLNPAPNQSEAITILSKTLDKTYFISISDGRSFKGQFICIDKIGNIVLDNTIEFVGESKEGRQVGLVMIPKRWWTAIKIEVDEAESTGCLGA